MEFPRIDDRLAGLPARYAVSVGDARLVRYDLRTGEAAEHVWGCRMPRGGLVRRLVPSPSGPADEAAGWYLAYVYEPTRDSSDDSVIIDAATPAVSCGTHPFAPSGAVRIPRQLDPERLNRNVRAYQSPTELIPESVPTSPRAVVL